MKRKKLNPKQAAEFYGVHTATLRVWDKQGKIKTERTPGGDRRYLIDIKDECHICYCRVSSHKQKDDLERQITFMQEKFPNAEIVKDIGSGINFKRKGLNSILERAISGDSLAVTVAYKDRLARFGFELIKWIIERTGGKLVVLNESSLSPQQELAEDLLTILHVFSCRMHGLRSYTKQIAKTFSNSKAEENI